MGIKAPGYGVSVTWDTLPGKPATFPPVAHTHAWTDITGKPASYPPATHSHAGLLQLLGTATVGETGIITLALGVRRYTVAMAGAAMGDRIVATLTGAPQNGTLQDVYVSSAGNLSVGALVPAIGVGATIAIPLAFYKVI